MYIKVNNSSQVVNMDDYVLINDLTFHMRKVELSALKDGDNYYTKDEVQELIQGELDVDNFITENNLTDILKGYMTDFTMFYMQTNDSENEPDVNDASWSKSITNWQNNKYMWQLIEINRPGIIVRTAPVCISGPNIPEEDEEQVVSMLIEVRPQWCLNNDGNWSYEIEIPTEYDEVWIRNELIWDEGSVTYTEGTKDQIYEKVKELNSKLLVVEEDVNTLKTDVEELKENTVKKEDFNKLLELSESNLLENGDFFEGMDSWLAFGTGNNIPRIQEKKGEYPHGRAVVFQGEPSHVQYIYQPAYPLMNAENVQYTLSCMVQSDEANDGYDQPFYGLMIKVDYEGADQEINEEFTSEIVETDGNWHRLTLTFTATKVVEKFECYFYVRDTNKLIRASEMMLIPGDLAVAFRTNMEEIKSKIPSMDTIDDLQTQIDDLRAMIEELLNK